MCKQLCCKSFENEIADKVIAIIMYIYSNVSKQVTNVGFLLLYSIGLNHFTVCRQNISSK